jgi:Ca-activated chloride channel family protein
VNVTFAYPWVLLALAIVPVLAALRFVPSLRRRSRGSFVLSTASTFEEGARGWRHYLRPVADALVLVAISLVIVAMARPQTVQGERLQVEGIDIYLALDMSGSMRAIDASRTQVRQMHRAGETPNDRFEEAVSTLKTFIQNREHDRIGMTVFAKDAFLQFPLTLDYQTILDMLDRLELGDIDEGGTAIGNALGRSIAGLEDSEAETKIVVLITDGDRRGGNISPMQAAKIAKKEGIKVFPILVGHDGPTLVPVKVRNLFGGRAQTKYREQKFPVDPQLLENIAGETDGEFYRASEGEELRERLHQILDQFERTELKDRSSVQRTERFQPFVAWALALLALQFVARYTVLRSFP